jgi:hypothetical protein
MFGAKAKNFNENNGNQINFRSIEVPSPNQKKHNLKKKMD